MLTRARRSATVAMLAVGVLAGCAEVVETGPQAQPGRGFGDVIVTRPPTTIGGGGQGAGPVEPEPAPSYEEGDCLTWDPQSPDADFEVVPCSEEHFAEVAGPGDLSGHFGASDPYPPTDELSAAVADVCNPVVTAYLVAVLDRLDPNTVEAGVIPPTEATWAGGDRIAWCTVGLPRTNGLRPAYTGRIADGTASQAS